jgi:hypothetical protein
LNLGEQGAAFSQRESQVGNASILPLYHGNDRCFSRRRTRSRPFEAGFDNQSHGNSDRLAKSPA